MEMDKGGRRRGNCYPCPLLPTRASASLPKRQSPLSCVRCGAVQSSGDARVSQATDMQWSSRDRTVAEYNERKCSVQLGVRPPGMASQMVNTLRDN
jgi:hypothetical protein